VDTPVQENRESGLTKKPRQWFNVNNRRCNRQMEAPLDVKPCKGLTCEQSLTKLPQGHAVPVQEIPHPGNENRDAG